MKTFLHNLFVLLIGGALGALAICGWLKFDSTPPAPEKTDRIEVNLFKLETQDRWLEKVRFQVVVLDGVKSTRKYALLLMTPPPGGIHVPKSQSTWLTLTPSLEVFTESGAHLLPGEIQPIEIESDDFGPNGDQAVVKFIDEGSLVNQEYGQPSQRLWIGSPRT